jgi:hypothetical protein
MELFGNDHGPENVARSTALVRLKAVKYLPIIHADYAHFMGVSKIQNLHSDLISQTFTDVPTVRATCRLK